MTKYYAWKEGHFIRKSIISVLLFPALALFLFGCGKIGKYPQEAPKELIVWHWLSDTAGVFEELAEEYKKQKGVEVKFELYAPTEAYASKIRSAAQARKLPDIYGVLLEMRDLASFIKAGYVHDLTPYMEKDNNAWKGMFYESGLAMNSFQEGNQYGVKPGIYGVPININNIQMIYNIDLLKKAGWDTSKIPSTWDEFLELGDKLKKAGIPGLVSGWGETWMIRCLADNLSWNMMGKENIEKTIKGDIPYNDPSWVRVLGLFKDMKDHGLLFPGIVTMMNKEAEQMFANGGAAAAFNGSWCANVYESMNPDLKYKATLPPKVNPENPMYIWGGTTSFVVNDASGMKKEAVEFLIWLTDTPQQKFLTEKTNNIPANRHAKEALRGVMAEFADDLDNVVHPRLLSMEEFPLVTEAFDKGIQSIIIGEATPEEVAFAVEETKRAEIKRAEKLKALKEQNAR